MLLSQLIIIINLFFVDPIFMILEYMIGGKLQSYLRASRADAAYNNLHGTSASLTPKDLTLFTYQIARGMEFLARNGVCGMM